MAATDTTAKPHVVVVVNDDAADVADGRRSSVAGGGGGRSSDEEEEQQERRGSSGGAEIVERGSPVSERSVEVVDLGDTEVKVHLATVERDCRICQLSLDAANHESGVPIELGCSCKDDLAAAHKHCAEAWFKIKGNKTCEICGSTAHNVSGVNEAEVMEQWNESNDTAATTPAAAPVHPAETRNFWQGHRFLNFLLACMVFAFVISWLFHFNVPS